MTPASMTRGVEHIAPLEITVPIDGCDVTVTPLQLRDLPQFLALMTPLLASMPTFGPGLLQRMLEGELTNDELSGLISTIAVNGDDLVQLLVLCTRCHWIPATGIAAEPQLIEGAAHRDWVARLLLDRAFDLVAVVLQVNVDFFSRAMRQIKALASQARAARGSFSDTPTPSSS